MAFEEDGVVVAQIQSLARANDPIYEFGFRFMGGSSEQEKIWHHVLTQLADHLDAKGEVKMQTTCVDSRLQWAKVSNVWHNAMIRSSINLPVRLINRLFAK